MNVMQKNNSKTDTSVKAGLEIEAGHKKLANGDLRADKKAPVPHGEVLPGEKDPDDIVHQQPNTLPTDSVEQDLDEIVHEQAGGITSAKEAEDHLTEEEDMDELVHRNGGKR